MMAQLLLIKYNRSQEIFMVVVNADDFGMNHEVNVGISNCFRDKTISNTTIMANMPGFEEAVDIAKKENFMNCVGIHLNFFEGKPLFEPMSNDPYFCECGFMTSYKILHKLPVRYKFFLPRKTRKYLAKECEEQIKRFISAGFTQRHFDSHGHSHTIFSVWFSIKKVLKKYGFVSARKSLNYTTKKTNVLIKLYKLLYNGFLLRGFKKCKYFLSSSEDAFDGVKPNKTYEIMIHPYINSDGLLENRNSVLTPAYVKEKLKKYQMVSFNAIEKE